MEVINVLESKEAKEKWEEEHKEDRDNEVSSLSIKNYPNVKRIIYWYATGIYSGTGEALIEKEDGWLLVSLGHCSCMSAEENIDDEIQLQGKTLDSIKMSEERSKSVKILLDYIKE